MKKLLYYTYQLLISAPLSITATIITAITTIVGCSIGNGDFWGYNPGKWWSRFIIRSNFLPINVYGRENLKADESYVFCANHQGIFDVFIIYGYLNRNFKWLMKSSLRKAPLVGAACAAANHIFIDKSGPKKIQESNDRARAVLRGGMSMVIFPEGSRSWDGSMQQYRRGAFAIADELQLPIVPLTINGSFKVLPRQKGISFLHHAPLSLTIHKPIYPTGQGKDHIAKLADESYKVTAQALEK